jgi:predicted MFS family arabinose efflux permease
MTTTDGGVGDPVLAASPAARSGGNGGRIHYAWVVFAVAFVTLMAAAGFRSTPGVLIEPLEEEFGWSKATIGAAASVNLVLFGLIGPFAAALMGRFGLRRVVICALGLIAAGALATTQMDAAWQLIALWGFVVGIGAGCLAVVFAATVASRWFVARRGFVTGALTAATASGQLVFLPLLSRLAGTVGWRWVSITIALSALAVVPLVALFLRDRPEDVGLVPYGATADHQPVAPIAHPIRAAFEGLRSAWSSGAFWLLVGSFWVCGLSTNGLIQTHFIPAAADHGIDEVNAATLLALVGVFDVLGTLGSGWLSDRVDPRKLLLVYYGLRGLSLLVLHPALEAGGAGLGGFMVFYGLDWVATVPPTVALCAQVFGPARAPVVFGWVFASHQLGAAAAAWGAGATRDVLGSYQPAFVVAGFACLMAAVAVRYIHPPEAARSLGPDAARPGTAVLEAGTAG